MNKPVLQLPFKTWFISCLLGILLWIVILGIIMVVLSLPVHAQKETTWMWNCANPEGIIVTETGRIIPEGENFETFGYLNEDALIVIDGTVNADYVCEVVDDQ